MTHSTNVAKTETLPHSFISDDELGANVRPDEQDR